MTPVILLRLTKKKNLNLIDLHLASEPVLIWFFCLRASHWCYIPLIASFEFGSCLPARKTSKDYDSFEGQESNQIW